MFLHKMLKPSRNRGSHKLHEIIYFDKRLGTFRSIVDIYGNGRLTFQNWFIAIAHYLTF